MGIVAPAKRRLISDETTPNLYLCVEPSGTKSWKYNATGIGGRGRIKLSLGRFPDFLPADARDWAQERNSERARGLDPREVIVRRHAEQRAKQENTVATVWQRWLAHKRNVNEAPRSLPFYDSLIRRDVLPHVGDKAILEVTKADCRDVVTRIRERGSIPTANMTLSLLKSFFHWCAEFDFVEHNPAISLRQSKHVAVGSRALELRELALAYVAADRLDDDDRDAIRLLILTGARRWEILGATLKDYRDGVFEIPVHRSKSKRAHPLTLGSLGRPIFETRANRSFAFSCETPNGRKNFSLVKKLIDAMRHLDPGIAAFTLHGIRKGVRTALNSCEMHEMFGAGGLPTDICERVLNHAKGGLLGTYNKARDTRLIADALAAWETLLLQEIMNLSSKRVVSIDPDAN